MYLHPRLIAMAADVRWRILLAALVGLLAIAAGLARLAIAGVIIVQVVQGNAGFSTLMVPCWQWLASSACAACSSTGTR